MNERTNKLIISIWSLVGIGSIIWAGTNPMHYSMVPYSEQEFPVFNVIFYCVVILLESVIFWSVITPFKFKPHISLRLFFLLLVNALLCLFWLSDSNMHDPTYVFNHLNWLMLTTVGVMFLFLISLIMAIKKNITNI